MDFPKVLHTNEGSQYTVQRALIDVLKQAEHIDLSPKLKEFAIKVWNESAGAQPGSKIKMSQAQALLLAVSKEVDAEDERRFNKDKEDGKIA